MLQVRPRYAVRLASARSLRRRRNCSDLGNPDPWEDPTVEPRILESNVPPMLSIMEPYLLFGSAQGVGGAAATHGS